MSTHVDGLGGHRPEERKSVWRELGSFFFDVVKVAAISLAIVVPVRTLLAQPFYVQGESMIPNFHEKEYLIIDEISYRFHTPGRGDIVVFHPPGRGDEYYIKRAIGLPGEAIMLQGGRVYINEVALDESSYLDSSVMTRATTALLPEGAVVRLGANEYFVLGDNRGNSQDSRAFGPLPQDQIVGRAWLRGWPINRVGSVAAPQYNL